MSEIRRIIGKVLETLADLRPMHPATRAERRRQREMERSLQRAYRAICGISLEEAQAMFSRPLDDGAFQSLGAYPLFLDLRDRSMEAVSTGVHLLPEKVPALREVVTQGYELIGKNTYAGRTDAGNRLIFHTYEEFNGICAEISTNDVEVCRRVIAMDLRPPEPWVAFPELAETAFGFLQGNIEYWWYVYWEPYWESLDKGKQDAFLAGATDAWQACFWRHLGEGREIFEEMARSRSQEADRR
ncbi:MULTISPECIES: hypothetical protein [Burkholderiaceae]|uniref:hypothetical protein n=1 Tax=Burkholderiaceae TaxID=119060 RepID=UPI001113FA92|nr:hypothetical protein [Ralstonia sp. 25mfcol4.1]